MKECLGKNSCEIQAEEQTFAVTPGVSPAWCSMLHRPGASARLWAQVQCSASPTLSVRAEVPLASTAQVVLPIAAVLGAESARSSVVVIEDISRAVLYPSDAGNARGGHTPDPNSVDVTPLTAVSDTDHAGRSIVYVDMGSGVYELSMSSI